uniref:Candidate secreted effector n=1 Tax=Meloidogyne incognita TaxID=6306 RepID=A0A914LLQ8_MELIC
MVIQKLEKKFFLIRKKLKRNEHSNAGRELRRTIIRRRQAIHAGIERNEHSNAGRELRRTIIRRRQAIHAGIERTDHKPFYIIPWGSYNEMYSI